MNSSLCNKIVNILRLVEQGTVALCCMSKVQVHFNSFVCKERKKVPLCAARLLIQQAVGRIMSEPEASSQKECITRLTRAALWKLLACHGASLSTSTPLLTISEWKILWTQNCHETHGSCHCWLLLQISAASYVFPNGLILCGWFNKYVPIVIVHWA